MKFLAGFLSDIDSEYKGDCKFIAVKDSLFKTPVFCMQNIYVSILKHRCFETAVRIYFMNYVVILGKKIIFVGTII